MCLCVCVCESPWLKWLRRLEEDIRSSRAAGSAYQFSITRPRQYSYPSDIGLPALRSQLLLLGTSHFPTALYNALFFLSFCLLFSVFSMNSPLPWRVQYWGLHRYSEMLRLSDPSPYCRTFTLPVLELHSVSESAGLLQISHECFDP